MIGCTRHLRIQKNVGMSLETAVTGGHTQAQAGTGQGEIQQHLFGPRLSRQQLRHLRRDEPQDFHGKPCRLKRKVDGR